MSQVRLAGEKARGNAFDGCEDLLGCRHEAVLAIEALRYRSLYHEGVQVDVEESRYEPGFLQFRR